MVVVGLHDNVRGGFLGLDDQVVVHLLHGLVHEVVVVEGDVKVLLLLDAVESICEVFDLTEDWSDRSFLLLVFLMNLNLRLL